MGTPDFAVGVLKRLIEEKQPVTAVVTAPDRPAGRGRKLMESAVKKYAASLPLPVLQPTNLNDESFLQQIKELEINLIIVVAFRMLPKKVWEIPEYGTFNLHASLLPQYRGAAPINWAIINGEKKTGVTTFFIDEQIDTGAIIAKEEVTIAPDETAGTLHDKLMNIGSELVLKTVQMIEKGEVTAIPQKDHKELKSAPKLNPENTRIDWTRPGEITERQIRGLSPYPSAWTELENDVEILKIKIYQAKFKPESHEFSPGEISEDKRSLKVATPDGFLWIEEMQLPGKRKMDIISLLNGFTFSSTSKMR